MQARDRWLLSVTFLAAALLAACSAAEAQTAAARIDPYAYGAAPAAPGAYGAAQSAASASAAAAANANLGLLFHQAAQNGLAVIACWFPDGEFHDVGTPKGLAEALPVLMKGL